MSWLFGHLVAWIEEALVFVINLVIQSLADLFYTISALLPNMPTFPTGLVPSEVLTWFNYGAYWFPLGYLVSLVGVVFGIWITWIVLAIPLRWGKVIRGNQ